MSGDTGQRPLFRFIFGFFLELGQVFPIVFREGHEEIETPRQQTVRNRNPFVDIKTSFARLYLKTIDQIPPFRTTLIAIACLDVVKRQVMPRPTQITADTFDDGFGCVNRGSGVDCGTNASEVHVIPIDNVDNLTVVTVKTLVTNGPKLHAILLNVLRYVKDLDACTNARLHTDCVECPFYVKKHVCNLYYNKFLT